MTQNSTNPRRFFGIWRKKSSETKHRLNATTGTKATNRPYHQKADTLPPRMHRDVHLMSGMLSTAMGRR